MNALGGEHRFFQEAFGQLIGHVVEFAALGAQKNHQEPGSVRCAE
jgi:hypothetical protein